MMTLYATALYVDWSVANPVPSGKALLMLVPDRNNLELDILERTVCEINESYRIMDLWMRLHGEAEVLYDTPINQE